jgi:hypothetical protein
VILPRLAISVRQPWAWAIIHAGKDIENRDWNQTSGNGRRIPTGKRVCIHASQGMTRDEYVSAYDHMRDLDIMCPAPGALTRGAIIGTVQIDGSVMESRSPWFFGPLGLLLSYPLPVEPPIRAMGALGWFDWKTSDHPWPEPAKWMLPKSEAML